MSYSNHCWFAACTLLFVGCLLQLLLLLLLLLLL
jgi:hypothetical protein